MNKVNFKDFKLEQELLSALEKLGFHQPTEVQQQVIPFALKEQDIIVKSQTGSGKTGAFAIPICEKIEIESKNPQALVLTPTRELAVQVKEDISNIGRFKRIRCAAVFGKQPMEMQLRELKQRVHVVVGTPGRTFDHIERQSLDLSDIKYFIIDEADKMLDMGFIEQVEAIIKCLPKNRATMLFSATMPEVIQKLCNQYMIEPKVIEINSESITAKSINEYYYEVEDNEKFALLNKVIYIENPESCIIFCNTKEKVDNIYQRMKDRGYSCVSLHGGMEQKDRLETIKSFKRGEFIFLVATEVAARGIHIDEVSHVINYEVPMEKESYVHRIGRTGRAGKLGEAITFVSTKEHRYLNFIEEYIGYTLEKRDIPSEEVVEKAKAIFKEKGATKPKLKKDSTFALNKEITKLHISAGKQKKIRPGDIVGAITGIEGVTVEDIGIIDVQDSFSYVDILNKKGELVLKALNGGTIKGKKVRVEKAMK